MIAAWVMYVLLVSGLVGLAALAAERAARAQGWPVRWVWVGALVGSVAIPVVEWLLPDRGRVMPLPAFGPVHVLTLPPVEAAVPAAAGPSPATLIALAWAAVTVLLLGYLALSAARLWRRRRRWPAREVDGVEVLVSRSAGPAAMGVWRGRVVVPEWALSLDAGRRRLLVLHEAEHVRAGDPRLALGALMLCVLVPWNVVMWWQLRRLRLALELDCDARVLRRSDDRHGYGSLLLEVGQRRAAFALGLAEPKSMLERRIRMITQTTRGRRTLRALGLASLSGLALALACETPEPSDVQSLPTALDAKMSDDVAPARPTFTPMTERPVLRNADAVEQRRLRYYPPLLREAGIGGTTNVWVYIDAEGQVRRALVNNSSGHEALDQAAAKLATTMEFTPARNRDRNVGVWIKLDLSFGPAGEKTSGPGRYGVVPPPPPLVTTNAPGELGRFPVIEKPTAERPTLTPMTVRPMLRNEDEVQQNFKAYYPPLLRDAGIGGTTNVWFFIDADGRVARTLVKTSSGYDALDQAALKVANTMQFTPAYNRDEKVPVWVSLDITFEVE